LNRCLTPCGNFPPSTQRFNPTRPAREFRRGSRPYRQRAACRSRRCILFCLLFFLSA
jgi:hypothetical protein